MTSRRQISALLAIKVPPYRAIGRNNSVINLESFRGGPNSTLSLETKGERRNAGRLASSDPSPMGTTSLCLAAIKQSIYSWCRGRLRLQLIIQPGCPVNETSKNRGLEKLRSGTIRGEEEIARRVIRNWIPLDNIQGELGQVSRNSNLEDSNNY